jgi:hypothetical protein
MNQDPGEQDKNMISEEMKLQQDQINSLATSLEKVLTFLQDLKSRGNTDISNLFSISQESISYLNAVLNEFEALKQQTSIIKPGLILLKESVDKTSQNQAEIREDIATLRSEQSKIHNSYMLTKKSAALNKPSTNRTWKSVIGLEGIIGTIAISISIASMVGMASLTSKIHENNTAVQKDLKIIQIHMGIKKKK